MTERYIKKIITTSFNEFISQSSLLDTINSNFNIKVLVIGAIEKTTTEKEHFHCYIEFTRQLRFSSFKSVFPNIHLETIKGSPLDCYNYVTKEGLFYSNVVYEQLKKDYEKVAEEKDICESVIEDILDNGLTLYEILKKYPKFAFYNFKTIQEIKNISLNIDDKNKK